VPLRAFAPLAKLPGVRLVSLQKGFAAAGREGSAGLEDSPRGVGARLVYRTNDARAEIKRRINQRLGSPIREEKSYTATQECAACEAVG
jgi:hypothetical protein